jgi:FAD/FMN-containing dehydrogenase
VTQFLERVLTRQLVADGTVAQDESQVKSLWFIRENIPEAANKFGKVYKYDISIPQKEIYEIVEIMREKFGNRSDTTVIGYGHLGDGILCFVSFFSLYHIHL